MAKDIDKIFDDVNRNLKAIDIKKANGLTTDKEYDALADNLNDIMDSELFHQDKAHIVSSIKEVRIKYPEYFLPIVANDPLVVIFERLHKILPLYIGSFKETNNELIPIKANKEYELIYNYLRYDLFSCYYQVPTSKNKVHKTQYIELGCSEILIKEFNRLYFEYLNSASNDDKDDIKYLIWLIFDSVSWLLEKKPSPFGTGIIKINPIT